MVFNNLDNFFMQPVSGSSDNKLNLAGTMNATGTVNLDGITNTTGTVNLDGTITATGDVNLDGTTTATGIVNLQGTTTATGTMNLDGTTNADGTVNLEGTTNANGAVNLNDTTNVTGTLDINSGGVLDIDAGATINSSILVQTVVVSATASEINSGKTIISGIPGKQITILNYGHTVIDNDFNGSLPRFRDDSNNTILTITSSTAVRENEVRSYDASGVDAEAEFFMTPLAAGDGVNFNSSGSTSGSGLMTVTLMYTIT